jgi:hypothetical protein
MDFNSGRRTNWSLISKIIAGRIITYEFWGASQIIEIIDLSTQPDDFTFAENWSDLQIN